MTCPPVIVRPPVILSAAKDLPRHNCTSSLTISTLLPVIHPVLPCLSIPCSPVILSALHDVPPCHRSPPCHPERSEGSTPPQLHVFPNDIDPPPCHPSRAPLFIHPVLPCHPERAP